MQKHEDTCIFYMIKPINILILLACWLTAEVNSEHDNTQVMCYEATD